MKSIREMSQQAWSDFKSLPSYLQGLIALAIGGVILYTAIIFGVALGSEKIGFNDIGSFGDSFGAMTSFFSCLTVIGLLITISQQREANQKQHKANELQQSELDLTLKELQNATEIHSQQSNTIRLQQFENTFFYSINFLEKHLSILAKIDKSRQNQESRIRILADLAKTSYDEFIEIKQRNPDHNHCVDIWRFYLPKEEQETISKTLNALSICLDITENLCPEDKKTFYVKILANRLSNHENEVIFYLIRTTPEDELEDLPKLYKKLGFLRYAKHLRFGISEHHRNIDKEIEGYLN